MSTTEGILFSKNDVKRGLLDSNADYNNRLTWRNMYANVDLSSQQAKNVLKQTERETIADAVMSAYKSNQAIANSNLGQGYKLAAMNEIDNAMSEAYAKARQTYESGVATIDESANTAYTNIDSALESESTNMTKLSNTAYAYLKYLYDTYANGEDADNIFYNDDVWKNYTYEEDELDENGVATGNKTGRRLLKSWDDLKSELIDSEGNLTVKGTDFYDLVLNREAALGKSTDYLSWLRDEDSELYDWAISGNPYDASSSAHGNIGALKQMVGLKATDYAYSFLERYGGWTETELDDLFTPFTEKAQDIANKIADGDGIDDKEYVEMYQSLTTDLTKVTDSLGITSALEKDLGMSLDTLVVNLADASEQMYGKGDMAFDKGVILAGGGLFLGGTAAALATAVGASAASGIGLPIAIALGGIAAIIAGIRSGDAKVEQNKAIATQMQQSFDNVYKSLVNYAQQQRTVSQASYK